MKFWKKSEICIKIPKNYMKNSKKNFHQDLKTLYTNQSLNKNHFFKIF